MYRVEIVPNNFSENLQSDGDTQYRPFCISSVSSSSNLLELKSRPMLSSGGCIPTRLEPILPICFPSFLPHFESLETIVQTKSGKNDISYPIMANPTMVSSPTIHVHPKSNLDPHNRKLIRKPIWREAPINSKLNSRVSGLAGLRDTLSAEGISSRASELIINARREGTRLNYESAWKKWFRWCSRKQVNPFECVLNHILEFLSDLFHEGLEYRTIGVHRSAISAYHLPVDGINIGKHPRVSSLMAGISNLRPPRLKYCTIWDVQVVLDYLRQWSDYTVLSPKQLTLKVAMLLALIAINRGSELKLLDLSYMAVCKSKYVFSFGKTVKHSREGKTPPAIEFNAMIENINLCPVAALNSYITLTAPWRNGETQLFLSFVKPHKAVSKSTITRWMKEVLKLSGINTDIFQTHSVRAASSSKVAF